LADEKLFDLGISGADNDDVGFSNGLLKIGPEMRKQVGENHIEKLLVATEEIFGLHDAIKNRDFKTLAYQVLGREHRRAVTHIIGPLFETQADEAHLAFAGFKNHACSAHQMRVVAGHQAVEQRCVYVQALCQIGERAHILWQTGAAKGKSRHQIARRRIQLGIFNEDFHDALTVNRQILADSPNFICKHDLRRVVSIAGVLQYLRLFEFEFEDWRTDPHGRPQIAQRILLPESISADDYVRRFVKIAYGTAFAEKFRIEVDCKIFARLEF